MSEFSHKEAQRLIHQRRLSAAERQALSAHLSHCASCGQHAVIDGLLSKYLVLNPANHRPTSAQTAVYLGRVRRHNRRQRIMKPVFALAGIAAIILLAVAGWLVMRPNIEAEPLEQTTVLSNTVAAPAYAQALLDGGANPDAWDNYGNTALHYAAQQIKSDVLLMLLDRGASIDAQNDIGNTPLHLAAQWNKPEQVTTLIEHGAALDLQNNEGQRNGRRRRCQRRNQATPPRGRCRTINWSGAGPRCTRPLRHWPKRERPQACAPARFTSSPTVSPAWPVFKCSPACFLQWSPDFPGNLIPYFSGARTWLVSGKMPRETSACE